MAALENSFNNSFLNGFFSVPFNYLIIPFSDGNGILPDVGLDVLTRISNLI